MSKQVQGKQEATNATFQVRSELKRSFVFVSFCYVFCILAAFFAVSKLSLRGVFDEMLQSGGC